MPLFIQYFLMKLTCLALGYPLSANLDPGFAESLDHLGSVNAKGESCLARVGVDTHLK